MVPKTPKKDPSGGEKGENVPFDVVNSRKTGEEKFKGRRRIFVRDLAVALPCDRNKTVPPFFHSHIFPNAPPCIFLKNNNLNCVRRRKRKTPMPKFRGGRKGENLNSNLFAFPRPKFPSRPVLILLPPPLSLSFSLSLSLSLSPRTLKLRRIGKF